MKITAAQHVSGVLTDKQSPNGQGGYQTLFHTRDLLSVDEVRIIERQVQQSAAGGGKALWQSYCLNARRHVITRVVPINAPDEFGRRGRFFTHSLVFDEPDDVPFGLLRPGTFFSSLEDVLACEAAKTGHIPAVQDSAGAEWVGEAKGLASAWSVEELNRLFMLASDPREVTGQGQHVALVGSEAQIIGALKVAALLAPPRSRKLLTFDTNASGGESSPGATFWGRGSTGEVAAGARYVIDGARRQITLPESSPLRAAGLSPEQLSPPLRKAVTSRFGRASEKMLGDLLERRYAAFIGEAVYQSLLRERGLPLTSSDTELLNPFAETHRGLGLLLALKSGDEARRLQTLAMMSKAEYVQRVKELKTYPDFAAWQAFSPIWMPTWFELFQGDYNMKDITGAVASVAEHGSADDRLQVEYIYERLKPVQRQELGRWLKASPHRFERLQAALDKPDNASAGNHSAGGAKSLWRRLRHPFTR